MARLCIYVKVTQGAEYALISLTMLYWCFNMSEYALIMLNMIEYLGIFPKNWVLNRPELFWICRMQYIAWGYCTIYWAVTETEIFRKLSNIWDGVFCKKNKTLVHILSKTQEKEVCWETFQTFFSQILLKVNFELKIQPHDGYNQGLSFQSQNSFFDIKKGRGGLPSPP